MASHSDAEDRNSAIRIRKNVSKIKETLSTDIEPIIDKLIENNYISPEQKDRIDSECIPAKKVDEVLKIIMSHGYAAFSTLMDIIMNRGYDTLVRNILTTTIDDSKDAPKPPKKSEPNSTTGGKANNETQDLLLVMKKEIMEEFKKNGEKMDKISKQLGKQDQINQEHDRLLNDHEKLIGELSFLRVEITSLKNETDKLGLYKEQLNIVLEKYKELRKEADIIPELRKENTALQESNNSLHTEIQSLTDSLSRLRRTIRGRYETTPVKKLPPISRKKAN